MALSDGIRKVYCPDGYFVLAKDVNQLMMAMAQESLNIVHTSSMADDAVLVRLLMRAAGFY